MAGAPAAAPAMQNLIGNLTHFNFNHNGQFTFNPTAQSVRVVDFQSNGKQILNSTTDSSSNSNRGNPAHLRTESIGVDSEPITFIEQGGVDTGVFGNWDGAHVSNIVTLSPAEETSIGQSIRGQSATFNYNSLGGSIVGGFAFGSITMTATNGTWPSGTRIPVTLTDMDENKNSKVTEHLNDYGSNVDRVSTMKIGTPFSLNAGKETAALAATAAGALQANGTTLFSITPSKVATAADNAVDESFSNRPVFSFTNGTVVDIQNTGALVVDTGATMQTLLNTIHNTNTTGTTAATRFHGFNFVNFDLRGFTSLNGATGTDPTAVQVFLAYNSTGGAIINSGGVPVQNLHAISIANATNLESFVNTNATNATGQIFDERIFSIPATARIGFVFQFTTSGTTLPVISKSGSTVTTAGIPAVADIFSIGIIGDGTNNNQRINNAIYRWELEETGDNTGVFAGTTQFLMLNQLNLLNPSTYANLRTINHDVLFVAIQDMLQSEARAPQVTYLDLGADGVNTQISAQQGYPNSLWNRII
ncbi:hypothetical protein [Candidatus Nitrosotalea sp. TS]|uniref:hypothetical protein n=1 Tax=Candidatus Nitrosotalea sp. TS TaxID=2341020 RepID=UPI0021036537|nr:hypothetical protein [Candidatus Nitrosotalea sp. TS]